MSLIVIPNVSEGRDQAAIQAMTSSVEAAGGRVLDVHSDPHHHRSVFTVLLEADDPMTPMVELARSALEWIDLRHHDGIHPRLGAFDVCPFVPLNGDTAPATEAARAAGRLLGGLGIPVYLYGRAATRPATAELPDLRRGGLEAAIGRFGELPPDFGPPEVDPRVGITCVGSRDTLIAFNVWLRGDMAEARRIATSVRTAASGLQGVRAIGLLMEPGIAQVSMNLTDPAAAGIDVAFEAVKRACGAAGAVPTATELVGLVPQRFLPDPNAEAARLLVTPGRSLESAIEEI